MLRTSEILRGAIRATDGSIGSIDDLLIDDQTWIVRWIVIDTGSWVPGRKVLLPPSCFGQSAPTDREFPVNLTRQKVQDSPIIITDVPVSSRKPALYGHCGWASWFAGYFPLAGAGLAGPPGGFDSPRGSLHDVPTERRDDPHLCSAKEVKGYHIRATDDDIGHVDEFLVDQDGWAIRYIVVDTGSWWAKKRVLVSPQWIRDVSWTDQRIQVDFTRNEVKDSPRYDPDTPVDRRYREQLCGLYGYPPF